MYVEHVISFSIYLTIPYSSRIVTRLHPLDILGLYFQFMYYQKKQQIWLKRLLLNVWYGIFCALPRVLCQPNQHVVFFTRAAVSLSQVSMVWFIRGDASSVLAVPASEGLRGIPGLSLKYCTTNATCAERRRERHRPQPFESFHTFTRGDPQQSSESTQRTVCHWAVVVIVREILWPGFLGRTRLVTEKGEFKLTEATTSAALCGVSCGDIVHYEGNKI